MAELVCGEISENLEYRIARAELDDALKAFERRGFEFIGSPEVAQLRTELKYKDANISNQSSIVREGIICYPPKGWGVGDYTFKLVRTCPILESPTEALHLWQDPNWTTWQAEYFPSDEQLERALEESVDLPSKPLDIPLKRFGEEEATVFAFGGGDSKKAQEYGDFLKDTPPTKHAPTRFLEIKTNQNNWVYEKGQPYARFLCMNPCSSYDSFFMSRGMQHKAEFKGVRKVTDETYTPSQILNAFDRTGIGHILSLLSRMDTKSLTTEILDKLRKE